MTNARRRHGWRRLPWRDGTVAAGGGDRVQRAEGSYVAAAWDAPGGGCRVLLTTRQDAWPLTLGVRALALGLLTRGEVVAPPARASARAHGGRRGPRRD